MNTWDVWTRSFRLSIVVGLAFAGGCKPGVPDFKVGEVYSIKAGDAYPGQYLALKIVEISDGRTWFCAYRTKFDHRPTIAEVSGLTDRIPGLVVPEDFSTMDMKLAGILEPTPDERAEISAKREILLRGHERVKRMREK